MRDWSRKVEVMKATLAVATASERGMLCKLLPSISVYVIHIPDTMSCAYDPMIRPESYVHAN